jgi:hypothetical protein
MNMQWDKNYNVFFSILFVWVVTIIAPIRAAQQKKAFSYDVFEVVMPVTEQYNPELIQEINSLVASYDGIPLPQLHMTLFRAYIRKDISDAIQEPFRADTVFTFRDKEWRPFTQDLSHNRLVAQNINKFGQMYALSFETTSTLDELVRSLRAKIRDLITKAGRSFIGIVEEKDGIAYTSVCETTFNPATKIETINENNPLAHYLTEFVPHVSFARAQKGEDRAFITQKSVPLVLEPTLHWNIYPKKNLLESSE